MQRSLIILVFICLFVSQPVQAGLNLQFDYQYDTSGFFDDPARREALEMAGKIVNRYVDDLAAIEPDENNTWTTFFSVPGGSDILLSDVPVPEDTVIIYVGSQYTSGRLAFSIDAPGIPKGTPEFEDAYNYRSQPGAASTPATDYGLWGGTMTFNNNSDEVPWYFGTDINGIRASEFDFITVAMHELTHLLGFGLAKSFRDQTTFSGQFVGPEAVEVGSLTNRTLQLDASEAHFMAGTRSRYNGRLQESLIAPGIAPGQRQFLTQLDRAALRDIGWEEAIGGDANLDRAFNSSDLVSMFQGAKYETGELAGWAEGDFNDNALFTSRDLVVALATGSYVAAATSVDVLGSATVAPVVVRYDSSNGDLSLDASGQVLSSLEIESSAELFDETNVVGLDGMFDVKRPDKLFLMNLNGFSDAYFGSVLPTGLGFDEIADDLRINGSLVIGGGLAGVQLEVVPEPDGTTMVTLLALVFLLRRRQN